MASRSMIRSQSNSSKSAYSNITLNQLKKMDSYRFEHFVANVMRLQGYQNVKVTPRGPDGGKDIIMYNDAGKVFVECKRYNNKAISKEQIQKLHSAIVHEKAYKGVFVTTSHFTKTCYSYARAENIELIDGTKLISLCSNSM